MAYDETTVMGPVDYLLMEFPDKEPTGEGAAALAELVDAGIVHIYDIVAVRKDAAGTVSGFELTDLGDGLTGFATFAGARSGLLGDEDVAEAGGAMEPGTIAVLIVFENTWARRFVAAALNAGGQVVASARIPAEEIIEALDALEAQDQEV